MARRHWAPAAFFFLRTGIGSEVSVNESTVHPGSDGGRFWALSSGLLAAHPRTVSTAILARPSACTKAERACLGQSFGRGT